MARLARRTDFAGTADTLVIRHEHTGPQLSRNAALLERDAVRLDVKWRGTIRAACGEVAYRQWRTFVRTVPAFAEIRGAVDGGRRLRGCRSLGRMARHLPWSLPAIARALAMLTLGLPASGRLGSVLRARRPARSEARRPS